jgi:hypothetical protein
MKQGTYVEVYYNLHKKRLSYRRPGGKVQHTDAIALRDVRFAVQPAGRDRVRATGRKNVHAFVRGYLVDVDLPSLTIGSGCKPITYNPYLHETFVYRSDKKAVLFADRVFIEGPYIWEVAPSPLGSS